MLDRDQGEGKKNCLIIAWDVGKKAGECDPTNLCQELGTQHSARTNGNQLRKERG